ncbi:hypothetical protein CWB41_04160 [Methylovirgula ligni]|uniref:Uncharacterized protein n=1 Tax=Methylovirgula ligni TaxID=569860 RepID=A0A3D9YSM3_9HYPH|nr:hypothetical protein [Methylovirgula ligni]QAY95023.1 hypothetical protein CWB41_04160 [Methylovirgula ligni]REF84513.1 hypothetical protein DES32_2620 [Methylovirgula ligni]
MKYKFSKSSLDQAKKESIEEIKSREISAVREILEKLLTITTGSVGFPREDLSETAVQEGVELTREFLKILNPQARRLVIELVTIIAELSGDR